MKGRYIMVGVFVVVALLLIGTGSYYYYTYYGTPRCEACGMIITPEMDANIKMIDLDTNQRVWTCCPGCMLRSVVAHPNVHIEALDSWYGTSAPKIVIEIRNGSVVSVTPDTARILLGSKVVKSCANNRIAINETSAALLLQYGWNRDNPLAVFKNELPQGTPVLTVAQALPGLKQMGIQYVPPSAAFLGSIVVIGVVVLIIGILAWKKLGAPLPKPAQAPPAPTKPGKEV
ncbi:MAG: hypothetical protein HA492_05230 [Candidatus Verstraetearchaeota archaeon]|nr:hypothetical protein [Candidatus Verstraetearchaeota archaeon]